MLSDVETNSTTYDYLNKLFIITNATKTADSVLHFDLFSPGPVPYFPFLRVKWMFAD